MAVKKSTGPAINIGNVSSSKIMATDTSLDVELVEKAVRAVLKHHESKTLDTAEKLSLLGNERPVHVQFTLLRAPGHSKPKPVQIVVPHPFFKVADRSNQDEDEVEEPEICLIVKDSAKPWCQEMIVNFPDHMSCVKKVLTLTSLRKKYTSYAQKRELLHKYNMFMADDRILPMLSKALGNAFIQTKRLPVPINFTRQKVLPFAIQKALSATYMTINTGTCITIRAGHTGMDVKKLIENISAITEGAVPKMPRKWANVQSIGIKTADSISLPIYNKTPVVLRAIAKLAGIKPDVGLGGECPDVPAQEDDGSKGEQVTKKLPTKSPLLKALKKQKQNEENESSKRRTNETNMDSKTSDRSGAKQSCKRKTSEAAECFEIKTFEANKNEMKAKQIEKKPIDEKESPKKRQKMERIDDGQDDPASNKKFIKANKFKGSKKGFVFKTGVQGLGYYVDVKPVVDKAAMQAIMNLGKNKRSRGGQKKNKYKGTRKF
jgi:ribosome biogenesis protein UTP30